MRSMKIVKKPTKLYREIFYIVISAVFLGVIIFVIASGILKSSSNESKIEHILILSMNSSESVKYKGFSDDMEFYVVTDDNKLIVVNNSVWNQLTWITIK